MYLLILAAGLGKRLIPHTQITPKTITPLADQTSLLGRLLNETIKLTEIKKIIIITGYKKNLIKKYLFKNFKNYPLKIETKFNPNYAHSSPINSICIVKNLLLYEDFIIANSDSFFEKGAFKKLHQIENGFTLICFKKNNPSKDEMKVIVNKQQKVIKVGKSLSHTNLVSTGLFFVKSLKARKEFVSCLDLYQQSKINFRYWHDIVNHLSKKGRSVKIKTINPFQWFELDYRKDLKKINNFLLKSEKC